MTMLGGAWTAHAIFHLGPGPKRFTALRAAIPQVSPKVLSQRLKAMEARGLVRRAVEPTNPPAAYCALTEFGRQAGPVLEPMARLGERILAGSRSRAEPNASGLPRPDGAKAEGEA